MIVPDTIEPYIGYKALNISPSGTLRSPNYAVEWPIKKRLEAKCLLPCYLWTPVPVPTTSIVGKNPTQKENEELFAISIALPGPPYAAPPVELPNGWQWEWQPYQHQIGSSWCSCGIYAVKEKEDAFGYLRNKSVIVEIALWGQVTIGTTGARGQYAYPTKLWAPSEHFGIAHEVAERYGIEVEPQTFTTGRNDISVPSHANQTGVTFAILAILVYLTNLVHLLSGRPGPGWTGPALTITAMVVLAQTIIWGLTNAIRTRKKG